MRYKLSENTYILGRFPSGSTVTITLYDLSNNSVVSLSSNSCQEIGTTGIFKWSTTNISSQPTTRKEYLWIMSDGTVSSSGKIVLGGYPDEIASSSQIADAVWDEAVSDHQSSGTFGKVISFIKNLILGQ